MPLFLIGGPIGSILFDIPLVVICVLLASLFECFMVLPGHLWHAFDKIKAKGVGASRQRLESGVENFQEKIYRPCVALAVRYRGATLATALALLIFSLSLFGSGAVKYRFFPGASWTMFGRKSVCLRHAQESGGGIFPTFDFGLKRTEAVLSR